MTSDLRLREGEALETFKIRYHFKGEVWERQKWGRNIKSKQEEIRKGQTR